jgi:hypothetical protein
VITIGAKNKNKRENCFLSKGNVELCQISPKSHDYERNTKAFPSVVNSALKPKNQNIGHSKDAGGNTSLSYHNKRRTPTNVQYGQLAQCFELPTNCRRPSLPIRGLKSKQQHKTRQETVTLRGYSN